MSSCKFVVSVDTHLLNWFEKFILAYFLRYTSSSDWLLAISQIETSWTHARNLLCPNLNMTLQRIICTFVDSRILKINKLLSIWMQKFVSKSIKLNSESSNLCKWATNKLILLTLDETFPDSEQLCDC